MPVGDQVLDLPTTRTPRTHGKQVTHLAFLHSQPTNNKANADAITTN
jgi:hypothetical protein